MGRGGRIIVAEKDTHRICALDGKTGTPLWTFTAGGRVNNWLTVWSTDGSFLTYSSNAAGDGSMDSYIYDLASANRPGRISQAPSSRSSAEVGTFSNS